MKFKMRQVLACVMALAIAALVTACGSSGGDSTSTETAATEPAATETETTTSEATGTPIKVGHISDVEGESHNDTLGGVEAGIKMVNDEGGIDGHPLELTVCDADRNPNVVRACARKAVSDGVVAFLGNVSSAEEGFVPVIDQAEVAAIGAILFSPVVGESPTAYCFNGGLAAAVVGLPGALKAAGAKKVALLYPANVGGASAAMKEAWEFGVESSGLEDAGSVGFDLGETQFDAQVAKATSSGADGVGLINPGEGEAALVQAVRQQAPDLSISAPNSLMSEPVLSALGSTADGVGAVGIAQPSTAEGIPGIDKYNEAMDAFDPEGDYARNDTSVNSWSSVWAFQKVATGLPEITRESVLKAMEGVKKLDLGGIFPPLSAPDRKGNPPGLGCAMAIGDVVVEIKDGKAVAPEPGKFFEPFAG